MSNNNKIGVLWKKQDKDKKEMLSGEITIEGKLYNIVCFLDKYKTTENGRPDFNILLSTNFEKKVENTPQQTTFIPPKKPIVHVDYNDEDPPF